MNGSKKHQKGEMPDINKKITSLFLIAFFALAACSQQTENTTVSTESENESQKRTKRLIVKSLLIGLMKGNQDQSIGGNWIPLTRPVSMEVNNHQLI